MALVAGTTHTYNQAGLREDLWDTISNISPMDRPFTQNMEKIKANARLHEWLTDSLAAAATNSQLEGDDASFVTAATVTRLSAPTQILRKQFAVSGTLEAVDKAGRKSEIKYQLKKLGNEILRDLEYAAVRNQTGSAGGIATARAMTGAEAWIPSSENGGNAVGMGDTTGTTSSFAAGHVVTDATAASGKPVTSTALLSVLQKVWNDGGEVDTLMSNSGPRGTIRLLGNLATNNIQLNNGGETVKLIDGAEIYVTDYGKHKLVLNRHMRQSTVLALDTSMWALAFLRPLQTKDIADTGDTAGKKLLVMEATLVCRNPDANGKVHDTSQ